MKTLPLFGESKPTIIAIMIPPVAIRTSLISTTGSATDPHWWPGSILGSVGCRPSFRTAWLLASWSLGRLSLQGGWPLLPLVSHWWVSRSGWPGGHSTETSCWWLWRSHKLGGSRAFSSWCRQGHRCHGRRQVHSVGRSTERILHFLVIGIDPWERSGYLLRCQGSLRFPGNFHRLLERPGVFQVQEGVVAGMQTINKSSQQQAIQRLPFKVGIARLNSPVFETGRK